MKTSNWASALVVALCASVAQAQVIKITVPDDLPLPASSVTRAEVIANFHMWRLSGMQELHRGERTPDTNSLEYRKAQAKYEWLLASPQFAALVAELTQRPFATVQASKQ